MTICKMSCHWKKLVDCQREATLIENSMYMSGNLPLGRVRRLRGGTNPRTRQWRRESTPRRLEIPRPDRTHHSRLRKTQHHIPESKYIDLDVDGGEVNDDLKDACWVSLFYRTKFPNNLKEMRKGPIFAVILKEHQSQTTSKGFFKITYGDGGGETRRQARLAGN